MCARFLLGPILLVLLLAPARADEGLTDQIGVMLQVDNLLPKSGHWGTRAEEMERQFELLEQAGVRWTRVGILWEQIEPKPGEWEWSAADAVVKAAEAHHLKVVWFLGSTAPWDSTDDDWDGAPRDLDNPNGQFPQYVRRIVERYKGRIACWEVRNEPNLDKMTVEQYATYLCQASREIRSIEPSAKILLGGLGGRMGQELNYFRKLMEVLRTRKEGIPFDVANFHVYPDQSGEEGMKGEGSVAKFVDWADKHIDEVMKETGLEEMPAWITEVDYPAAEKHQSPDPEYNKGEPSQIAFIRTLLRRFIDSHPNRRIFYASLLDDYNSGGEFQSTGLFASDADHRIGKRRESYVAMKALLEGDAHR